ncbi:MAG: ATP-binding cassette domain-containing protein, partial [Deltaproteobacteria bacterium]|nr:ATP-binding cassette domain-containing protein [Deltaproteobacteria bacterium]
VELSLSLSGVSPSEKRRRAIDVLTRVGLKEHLHKNPNQLSGGQMQRVAIARALVNDPEILLCDEPTGSLDSVTSIQILDLIKEIASDRLVIMVTHNSGLAEKYAGRIIKFEDGVIISDTRPHEERPKADEFKLKKTSMSFFTALNLSYNNIRTKKVRTFLTAFASSIGIIGIAIILSLSTGFQVQIDQFQSDAMAEFPILISQTSMQMTDEAMKEARGQSPMGEREYVDSDEVFLYDPTKNTFVHKNVLTGEFVDYVKKIDPEICSNIGYVRLVNMNLIRRIDGKAIPVEISSGSAGRFSSGSANSSGPISSMRGAGLSSYPVQINKGTVNYLHKNYELLAGSYPESNTDLVLVIDTQNRIDYETLRNLGFDTADKKSVKFTDIVGTQFKVVSNDDYYIKTGFGTYVPGTDYEKMYDSPDSITLKISGIIRQSPDSDLGILAPGLAYSDE